MSEKCQVRLNMWTSKIHWFLLLRRKNEQILPTMFLLLLVQFEKKKSPFSSFSAFSACFPKILHSIRISQKKLHQTTSRLLGLWESYRGFRRTNAPRHVAFSSGYSIPIFIRHAFGKFVRSSSWFVEVFCCPVFEKVKSCGSNVWIISPNSGKNSL